MEFINYTFYTRAEDIKRLKFVSDNIKKKSDKPLTIIDIGCGNGNISYQLAKSGHLVTGIDISEETILFAKKNYGDTPGLEFKIIDIESFNPVESEKYDVIVCSEVLEHLFQPERLTLNFKKLLKVGGIAVITVPNGFGPRELLITKPVRAIFKNDNLLSKSVLRFKNFLGYKGDTKQSSARYLEHVQFFSAKNLSKLAEISGFRIIKIHSGDFISNVFPFSLIYNRLLFLQKFDCFMADILPVAFTSQFYTLWKQKE